MSHYSALSRNLAQAWDTRAVLDVLATEHIPADAAAAYAIQHEVIAQRGGRIGGWKVGAKSPTGPVQCAPLPIEACCPSGVKLARSHYAPLGLELEIAFRFGRSFEPRDEPYPDDEVADAIESMAAAIEIVASRYARWPDVDKRAQLADLQNHGALIVGEAVQYRRDFAFMAPALRFDFDGASVVLGEPANPAGDPRRLLAWLVNHCTQQQRIAVTPDMIVTTGSYTGMFFPKSAGVARGEIDGLPAVDLALL
jgi:2-keto-4-pentenoate hydratase